MLISIDRVSKRYTNQTTPVLALGDISLGLARDEFVSIIGPSGCGKSSLLMITAGLVPATSGSVIIAGQDIRKPYTDLGIVFQKDALLDWRNVLQNILLQAEIRRMNMAVAEMRARSLLEQLGLNGCEKMYPHELSGGMRQRVAICRALLHKPSVLLMDEPFGALDALTRDQLNLDLVQFCEEESVTVLFVTHSISEAVFLSDRVVVMSQRPGRVQAIIPIDLPKPRRLQTRDTAPFAGCARRVTDALIAADVLRETGDSRGTLA